MASFDQIRRLLSHAIKSRHQVSTDLHRENRGIDDAEIGSVIDLQVGINDT
jgi:hypothetical protein